MRLDRISSLSRRISSFSCSISRDASVSGSQLTFSPNSILSFIFCSTSRSASAVSLRNSTTSSCGAEDRAEAHGDDGELVHHRLVDVLVRQRVLARGVVDDHRRIGDDGRQPAVVDGVDLVAAAADADVAESAWLTALDDAVDVLALVGRVGQVFGGVSAVAHDVLVDGHPATPCVAAAARLSRSAANCCMYADVHAGHRTERWTEPPAVSIPFQSDAGAESRPGCLTRIGPAAAISRIGPLSL